MYKVSILNSAKRDKKLITRQLHHYSGSFRTLTDMRVRILEELKDQLPNTIDFDIGYYEKRSCKCWLVTQEDLTLMYGKLGKDISLWCDAGQAKNKGVRGI